MWQEDGGLDMGCYQGKKIKKNCVPHKLDHVENYIERYLLKTRKKIAIFLNKTKLMKGLS